jgi:hypothetical protein
MITVKLDKSEQKKLEKKLRNLAHKTPNVLARAINRVVSNVGKNIKKNVRENYEISSRDVGETLDLEKANKNRLVGRVVSTGNLIPIYNFKMTPNIPWQQMSATPLEYRVKIKKKEGYKKITGMFVQILKKTGKISTFERVDKNHYPLRDVYSLSVPQMIGNKEVLDKIEKEANETLRKRVNHEVERMISNNK